MKGLCVTVISSPCFMLLFSYFYLYLFLLSMPYQDFLFPRNLQSNYRSHRMLPHASPPVDSGRPLFPPVRHLSFHSPLTTCPDNYLNTVDTSKPKHMSTVKPSSVQPLPSADGLQQLQLTEPPVGSRLKLHTMLKSPER